MNGKKKQKGSKTCNKSTKNKLRPSCSTFCDLEFIDEEAEKFSALTKETLPVPHDPGPPYDDIADHPGPEAICNYISNNDCPEADMHDDCVISNDDVIKSEHSPGESVNLDTISQLQIDEDQDFELQAMFYLPKWDSAPPPSSVRPEGDENLNVILASVAELLSRSPPSLTDDLQADVAAPSPLVSPQQTHQPFQVSFTLAVEDDDNGDEVVISDASSASLRAESGEPTVGQNYLELQQRFNKGRIAAESPTWDEVFGDEEVNNNRELRDNSETDVEILKEEWIDEEIKGKNERITEEAASCWNDDRNEETPDFTDDGVKDDVDPQMDNSMDLFGDDEAFLQMTIPDISTPGNNPRTSSSAGDIADSTNKMHPPINPCSTTHKAEGAHRLTTTCTEDLVTHTPHARRNPHNAKSTTETEHNADTTATSSHITVNSVTAPHTSLSLQQKSFDCSHDYFLVNFDLGYSLDDSEEEGEEDIVPDASTSTSPLPKKQTVADSSTPFNSFHRARVSLQFSESKLPTPRMLSEQRRRKESSLLAPPSTSKGGALPSPITSPGVRWMISPGPSRTSSPSLPSNVKQRQLDSHVTEAERASGVENITGRGSVCAADSPSHPGWFSLQEI